jgi:hypothetical protein
VDERVLQFVADAGYSFDASVFPSYVLAANRLLAYRRSTGKRAIFRMSLLRQCFASRRPYPMEHRERTIMEFPVAVTPRLRLPVYHTISHFLPAAVFERMLLATMRSPEPLPYEFHAADLLDVAADRVDERMARHPGMRIPLAMRRASLARILETIARGRRVVSYEAALASLLDEARVRPREGRA